MIPTQPKGSWWQEGRFGIETTVNDADIAKLFLLQLGWTSTYPGQVNPHTKVRLVRPDGFVVHSGATAKHLISQEHAATHGLPLASVLREFFADAKAIIDSGGRITSHHLGFDAAVILQEMEKIGSTDMAGEWDGFVRKGICTMNKFISNWVFKQVGQGDKPLKIPLKLTDGIEWLVPQHAHLTDQHHDAGADSLMHWHLAYELVARARHES